MTTQCAGAQGQLPTSLRPFQLPLKRIRSLGRRRDRQLPLLGVAYYSCSIQSHAIQFIPLFEARMRTSEEATVAVK